MVHKAIYPLLASILLTISTLLPGAARPATAASPVTLKFAVEITDTPTLNAVKQYLIAPFERAHPNIKIQLISFNGASGLDQQLKVTIAAGSGPDVYDENGPSWMPPFDTSGGAANLDPYAKQFGWQKKLTTFAYQSCKFHGHLYCLPTESETLHLWYNATLLRKYGWKVPRTYTQLVALGKKIQAKGLQVFGTGFADCKPCWEWWAGYALNAYVGYKKLHKILTGQIPWTDPEVKVAFSMLKNLWDQGFFLSKQAMSLSGNDATGTFTSGRSVFKMEGTWDFSPGSAFAWDKKFTVGVAPLPTWRTGINLQQHPPIGIGEVDAMNGHTRHAKEAAIFLDWFVHSPTYAATLMHSLASVWVPPLHYSRANLATGLDPRFKKVVLNDARAMGTGTAGYLPWSAWPSKTETYTWQNLESMLLGQMSIDSYLRGMENVFLQEKRAGALPYVPAPS